MRTMKGALNYSIVGALIAIVTRMTYFLWLAPDADWDMYVRFGYLLLFLLSLFMGLRAFKKHHQNADFNVDVKHGMKLASVFAIIISTFTWVYYKWINPAYFADRIQAAVDAAQQQEVEVENVRQSAEFIFNAFTHSTLTLFGMMVIGFFYTAVLVLIMRAKPEVFLR